MPTMYEMLIGAGPQGPEETAATAQMLRNREGLGVLGMVTGDRILSPIGQGLTGQASESAAGLQKSRQQNLQRGMLTDMYTNQDEVARMNAAERERHNRAMEEIHRMRKQNQNASGLSPQQEKNVERLGKRVEPFSELLSTMGQIDALLTPYLQKDADGNVVPVGDVPGVGMGQGLLPNFMRSQEGNEIRGRVQELRNIILKVRSGAAVTPSEAGRLDAAMGLLDTANDENFVTQYLKARELVDNTLADIQASYEPEVVQTYGSRGGRLQLTPLNIGASQPENDGVPGGYSMEVAP